jgi:hypothetical protein
MSVPETSVKYREGTVAGLERPSTLRHSQRVRGEEGYINLVEWNAAGVHPDLRSTYALEN